MKKVLSCLLVVLLLAAIPVTAFASNFVDSTFNAGAPAVDAAADADGKDVAPAIEITPVTEAETLPDDAKADLEDARKSLEDAANLADLNADLKEAAGDKNLAVSDLFDISAKEDISFPATITLKNNNLANFAGLLHFVDGEWQWVDTEVDGDSATFTVDSLSPFAILVYVDEATSPATGDSIPYGFILGAVVLAGAAAWFFVKSRKVKA